MKTTREEVQGRSSDYRPDGMQVREGRKPQPPNLLPSREMPTGVGDSSSLTSEGGHHCSTIPTSQLDEINSYYLEQFHKPSSIDKLDTANLLGFSHPWLNETTQCQVKYIVKGCGCGHRVFPQTCMNLRCTSCQPYTSKRRGQAAFNRLTSDAPLVREHCKKEKQSQYKLQLNPEIMYTVFTVPLQIRDKFINSDYVKAKRKELWNLLKEKYGAVFAIEATHPEGDKRPGEFHPHYNFLWKQRKGAVPFIDVEALRDQWAALLDWPGIPVVNHRYSRSNAQIRHWANYVTRVFPEFSDWCGPVRWYGRYPVIEQVRDYICPDCGKPVVCIGWIDKELIDHYDRFGFASGQDPPWEDFKNIHYFKRKGEYENSKC